MNPQPFFDFIQERYRIFLKKQAGEPRPWTQDDILDYYKFTNVFREDDATTVWFRENVRDRLKDSPDIILATVLFRWFNRMTSGEALFNAQDLYNDQQKTAYDQFLTTGDGQILKDVLQKYIGMHGPFVTGAYIIKTPSGMTKLHGVCWAMEHFWRDKYPLSFTTAGQKVMRTVGWKDGADIMFNDMNTVTLEQTWDWLRKFSYLGDFMAYEVVTDLRFTGVLDRAPDIMTWANAGPGAMRGLNRIHGRELRFTQKKEKWNNEMKELLILSRHPDLWPMEWPNLEMREIEHSLCEFDKYQRVNLGEGKPRGVYK